MYKRYRYLIYRAWSEYRHELLFGFWAIPIILLVRLIRPLVHIRFGKLRSDRIGHYVYDYALMIAESELNNNKTIDLFCTHYPVCNEQFDKMIRRRSFVRDWVRYLLYWNKAIPFGEKHNLQNYIHPGSRDNFGWLEKTNVHFNFLSDEIQIVDNWLEKHNVKKERFVCLLIRDNAYLPDLRHHDYRNSDIDSYLAASKMIADDGITLIRMGKKMEKRFQLEHPNIIDYAFLDDKSDLLDVWLFANCEFCISTGTGIDAVSDIYRKPILYVNHNPIGHIHTWSDHIVAPKYLIWKDNGNQLTLSEQLEHNYLDINDYTKKGIVIMDLEEQDIIDAFRERLERARGTWQETEDDIMRQNKFFDILKSWEYFSEYHQFIHPKARVGSSWLRKMGDEYLV